MIIDWQHHYYPEELVKKHRAEPGGSSAGWIDSYYQIDEHLSHMDVAGIDIAVLSCWNPPVDECQFINDRLAQLQREYPNRFVGLAHVAPFNTQEALAELDRAITGLGLKGVATVAQPQGRPLDSPELWPFYEKVSALGVPIFVHATSGIPRFGFAPGFETALKAPYSIGSSLGWEFDLALAATRLIMGGVLVDFPDLKWVIAHLGGGLYAIKERLERQLPSAAGSRVPGTFREHFEKLYFDMTGFGGGTMAEGAGMIAVKCALLAIKPQKLVFATDFPLGVGSVGPGMKQYVDNIRKLGLPAQDTEAILGGNAKALLGI